MLIYDKRGPFGELPKYLIPCSFIFYENKRAKKKTLSGLRSASLLGAVLPLVEHLGTKKRLLFKVIFSDIFHLAFFQITTLIKVIPIFNAQSNF